jgi:hypothetical protein
MNLDTQHEISSEIVTAKIHGEFTDSEANVELNEAMTNEVELEFQYSYGTKWFKTTITIEQYILLMNSNGHICFQNDPKVMIKLGAVLLFYVGDNRIVYKFCTPDESCPVSLKLASDGE